MSAQTPLVPRSEKDLFTELKDSGMSLSISVSELATKCQKLAAMNGAGDGIREKIRKSFVRWVGGSKDGLRR
jgi:hypothetical protein